MQPAFTRWSRLTLLVVALAGCAASPRPILRTWQAPELRAHIEQVLCRLTSNCQDFRVRLLDDDRDVAELRFGHELVLSRGLAQSLQSEAELAFLLSHEIAHRELGHLAPRDLRKRLPLELAADAAAAAQLCALGLDALAGWRLQARLRDRELNRPEPSPMRAIMLDEFAARAEAAGPCPSGAAEDSLILEPKQWTALVQRAATRSAP